MMHDSEWTLKYDEPEVEHVACGCSQSATFSIEDIYSDKRSRDRLSL